MGSYIVVQAKGRVVKVTADDDGTVNKDTLRSAFQLEADLPIGLFRGGIALKCRQDLFELGKNWTGQEFELQLGEAQRSRKATPMSVAKGSTTSKRRKTIDPELGPLPVDGDVVSRIGQYAWFYTKGDNLKRSAIPLTKNLAITFRHGENKSLVEGDCITLASYQNQKVVVDTCVVLIEDALDLIVLQSKFNELCQRDLILEAAEPKRGMKYVLMGYSVIHGGTSHISFSAGIISSGITSRKRFLGSSGSFKGDSGGSCWSDDGRLIGMQVEVENVTHTKDNNGRPASPATGGRCGIIPIGKIDSVILKFLPPEEEIDWNE